MTDQPYLPITTPLENDTIFNLDLAAKLFQTYARLKALAWRHNYKFTDWLTMEDLEQRLGIDRATIFRHLGELKQLKLVRWDPPDKKRYRFFFLEVRLAPVAKSQSCDLSSSRDLDPLSKDDASTLLLDQSQHCDQSQSCDWPGDGPIDPEAYAALGEVGLTLEPFRTRLADMPHVTPRYVRALHAQWKAQGYTSGDIALLKWRIEHCWPEPEWCEQCGGLDGEHSDACPTQAQRLADEAAERERTARETRDTRAAEGPAMSAEIQEATRIWQQALGELQLQMTGATFDTWLKRSVVVGRENGTFVVGVHNGYAKDWLEHRLATMIERTLYGIVGKSIKVRFVVSNQEHDASEGGSHEA